MVNLRFLLNLICLYLLYALPASAKNSCVIIEDGLIIQKGIIRTLTPLNSKSDSEGCTLQVYPNGEEAIQFMRQSYESADFDPDLETVLFIMDFDLGSDKRNNNKAYNTGVQNVHDIARLITENANNPSRLINYGMIGYSSDEANSIKIQEACTQNSHAFKACASLKKTNHSNLLPTVSALLTEFSSTMKMVKLIDSFQKFPQFDNLENCQTSSEPPTERISERSAFESKPAPLGTSK